MKRTRGPSSISRAAVYAASLAVGSAACGDETVQPPGACAVRSSPEVAARSSLTIAASDLGGSIDCIAVLIAPNLMLTAAHCVSRQVLGPFACDAERGWLLDEDGSGRGRIGELLPAGAVTVLESDERGILRTLALGRELIAFGASTRCSDDLAAIVLDRDLDRARVPLRLDSGTRPQTELTLARFDAAKRERLLEPVVVTQPATPLGSSNAPARALRASGTSCETVGGAPMLSPETGALVALSFNVPPSPQGCEAGADALGLQLSEYAAFLRDAAELASAELYVEAAPDAPEGDGHCPVRSRLEADAGSGE